MGKNKNSLINNTIKAVKRYIKAKTFPGSEEYWKKRYNSGGHSGDGSYNKLAEFKAKILNNFVI